MTVGRIVSVGDETDAIVGALRDAFSRKAEFIFTTGGLGPTADDMSLRCIAMFAGVRLEVNESAKKMVENWYLNAAEKGFVETAEMTPPRIKMATVPEGSQLLPNLVGAAPGIVLVKENCRIVALPGPPPEMMSTFEHSMPEMIAHVLGRFKGPRTTMSYIEVQMNDESALASLLARVASEMPGVDLKSNPRGYGVGLRTEVRIMVTSLGEEDARKTIEKAAKRVQELVQKQRLSENP